MNPRLSTRWWQGELQRLQHMSNDTLWRLVLYLLPLALGIFLTGYLAVHYVKGVLIEPIVEQQRSVVIRTEQVLSRQFGSMRRDMRLLSSRKPLAELSMDGDQYELADELTRFLVAADLYLEARVFASNGRQLVGVFLDAGRVPPKTGEELAASASRFAATEAFGRSEQKLFVSDLEFLDESTSSPSHSLPVFHIGTSLVAKSTGEHAVIVLTVDARPLLDQVGQAANGTRKQLHLFNRHGLLLTSSPNARRLADGDNIANEASGIPVEIWQRLRGADTSSGWVWRDAIWSHQKVSLASLLGEPQNTTLMVPEDYWFLLVELPSEHVQWYARMVAELGIAVTVLLALAVTWFGGRLILAEVDRRLQSIQLAAQHDQLRNQHLELQRAHESLRKTQKSLVKSETMAALGLTVAGVSHELNTPIGATAVTRSAMLRQLDQLAEQVAQGRLSRRDLDTYIEQTREALALIDSSMNRANGVVSMLKTMASERSSQEISTVNLRRLVQSCIELHRLEKPKVDVELQVDIPEDLEIQTRAGALGQVISNLLSNASKHAFRTRTRGLITVSALHDAPSSQVIIQVIDDGEGMDEEIQNKAFTPFFSTKRTEGGTGLGLSICHHLVTDLLLGHLELQSELGHGSCFKIVLPRTLSD